MEPKIQKDVFGWTTGCGLIKTDSNVKITDSSAEIHKELTTELGIPGKILFWSKSDGHKTAEKNKQIFISNSNIFTAQCCKVWWGDFLSNEKSINSLKKIARKFALDFFILHEIDGRFLEAVPTLEYLKERARILITKAGKVTKKQR
jgi:hypothetical protein